MFDAYTDTYNWLCSYFASNVRSNTEVFFSNNYIYLVLVIISVVLLAHHQKLSRGRKLFLAFFVFFMALVIYNPIANDYFLSFPSFDAAVFNRFWIVFPIWTMLAYVFTSYTSKFKASLSKLTAVLITSAVLVFSGNTVSNAGMYIPTTNPYKINDESTYIAEDVLELSDGEPTSVYIFVPYERTDANYIYGGDVVYGIKSYTGLIDVQSFEYIEAYYNGYLVSDITPDGRITSEYIPYYLDQVRDILEFDFDYVIFPTDERIYDNLMAADYELVCLRDSYSIYQRKTIE